MILLVAFVLEIAAAMLAIGVLGTGQCTVGVLLIVAACATVIVAAHYVLWRWLRGLDELVGRT